MVPSMDPAGYVQPPLAMMNCHVSCCTVWLRDLAMLTLSHGVVYAVACFHQLLGSLAVSSSFSGRLAIRISHENFIISLLPIIGQYSAPSTPMGGTMKYSNLVSVSRLYCQTFALLDESRYSHLEISQHHDGYRTGGRCAKVQVRSCEPRRPGVV